MKDALGHGSNARGVAPHVAGINKVGRPTFHPNARRLLSTRANVTVNPLTGQEITRGGTMVSRPGTIIHPKESLQSFANRNALAINGGAHVGKWTDNGKTYLEIADRVRSGAFAAKLGVKRDQIGVYDLDRKKFISTGGSGRL
jgi:hypothetical protein